MEMQEKARAWNRLIVVHMNTHITSWLLAPG